MMNKLNLIITILFCIVGKNALAYDFEVNGIYYGLDASTMTAYVTGKTWKGGGYSGDITIPSKVTYNTKELDITAIGENAFNGCDINSIQIPNTIISIGESAFKNCKIKSSIELPNALTTIGSSAFSGSNIVHITIPNTVTSINKNAFYNCKELETCILSENIEIINEGLFGNCANLKNIDIPKGVKVIGYMAFNNCNSLTKLVIPSNVERINSYAFYEVSSITEEIIEDSNTPLYVDVYNDDMRPSKVYIGREVEGINILGWGYTKSLTLGRNISGRNIPSGEGLETIYSNIVDPQPRNKFWNEVYINCKLYIPVGTLGKYQSTDGWKEFFQIYEDSSLGRDDSPTPKCSKPTIHYNKGKIIYDCETDNVTFKTKITDTDITEYSSGEVLLSATYNISVYATKNGYENSETATATLCWIDVEPKTEGITNNVANVRAMAVMIQNKGSQLIVNGIDDGTQISVYNANGAQAGSAISRNGSAVINTNLHAGSVAIVKIGEKSIKVVLK